VQAFVAGSVHVVVYTMEGVVSVSTPAQAATALTDSTALEKALKDCLSPQIVAAICNAAPRQAVSKRTPGALYHFVLCSEYQHGLHAAIKTTTTNESQLQNKGKTFSLMISLVIRQFGPPIADINWLLANVPMVSHLIVSSSSLMCKAIVASVSDKHNCSQEGSLHFLPYPISNRLLCGRRLALLESTTHVQDTHQMEP
jgi:hypothetical protein